MNFQILRHSLTRKYPPFTTISTLLLDNSYYSLSTSTLCNKKKSINPFFYFLLSFNYHLTIITFIVTPQYDIECILAVFRKHIRFIRFHSTMNYAILRHLLTMNYTSFTTTFIIHPYNDYHSLIRIRTPTSNFNILYTFNYYITYLSGRYNYTGFFS